jgi:hypothetical protein
MRYGQLKMYGQLPITHIISIISPMDTKQLGIKRMTLLSVICVQQPVVSKYANGIQIQRLTQIIEQVSDMQITEHAAAFNNIMCCAV